MKLEHQNIFLQAVSNDLSLLEKMRRFTFKPELRDFTGINKEWYRALLQAKEKGYDQLNDWTQEVLIGEKVIIEKIENPKTDFLNFMETLKSHRIEEQRKKTLTVMEGLMKDLSNLNHQTDLTEEKVQKMEAVLRNFKRSRVKSNSSSMDDLVDALQKGEGKDIIPTFIGTIDEVIGGGLEKSALHVLGADSGSGKTTCGTQMAVGQAINDINVLYLSLEQKKEDMFEAAITVASQIANTKITEKMNRRYWARRHFESREVARERRELAREIVKETVMDFLTFEDYKYDDLADLIDRIHLGINQGADIIYIDNFQNIPKNGPRKSERENYDYFADTLDRIAEEYNIAIVLLSQISIDKFSKEVTTKYSTRPEQNAVTFLHLERVKEVKPNMIDISIVKARRGDNEKQRLAFIGELGLIGSINLPELKKEVKAKRAEDYLVRRMFETEEVGKDLNAHNICDPALAKIREEYP